MSTRVSYLTVLVTALAVLATAPVSAEITSIAGSTQVDAQEYRLGTAGESDDASATYDSEVDASTVLPLQVVAHLLATDVDAAASVAAQFADPLLTGGNPEEFAINLALLSATDEVRYTATATSRESRGILFTTEEYPSREAGDTLELVGQLYVDGALALFSPLPDTDLSNARVALNVTVVKQVTGAADETVFTGGVELYGGSDGTAEQSATGSFPTGTLVRSDLSASLDDFALFEVLIIPRLTIGYDYEATVGEPFTLQATVEVQAANAAGEVGVVALLGTPVDAIQEVVATVQSDATATKTINALSIERAEPTGEPAFPQAQRRLFLPACGLFGLEAMAGFAALVGLRCARPYARRRPMV